MKIANGLKGWRTALQMDQKKHRILTEQWPKTQEIRTKIDKMAIWLEQDQANHFFELVNFLMSHKVKPTHKDRMGFYDRGDRACCLDQFSDEEEEEENDGTE